MRFIHEKSINLASITGSARIDRMYSAKQYNPRAFRKYCTFVLPVITIFRSTVQIETFAFE